MDTWAQFLNATKDYWFLITAVTSALVTVGYMIFFQVNPWDRQREMKHRRKLVRFHVTVGCLLLEGGHFGLANAEFEAALKLKSTDEEALNGRYLSGLFLGLGSPDWDASAGWAVQEQLTKLIQHPGLVHVVEKYLGDLCQRTNQLDEAKRHYEAGLLLRPKYPDALYALGWFHYTNYDDLNRMEIYFEDLTSADPHDYRGFHGLGYALYMMSLREEDPAHRRKLISEAAKQSKTGGILGVNRWSIMADFGEVARSVDPSLSLRWHQVAGELLEDPELLKVNPRALVATLLMGQGQVQMKSMDEKRAWLIYQLALDYLAMHRLGGDSNNEENHHQLLDKARSLDPSGAIYPIYADQLAILDFLAPRTAATTASPAPVRKSTAGSPGHD